MATRFDQKIQELEDLVEKHLNLCQFTRNGSRCVLPANHPSATPHKFVMHTPPADRSAARRLIEEICSGGWVIAGPA